GAVRDRRGPDCKLERAAHGNGGPVRARLRLGPGDAALSLRARDRAGRSSGDHRPPALRRPCVRPLPPPGLGTADGSEGAAARGRAGQSDADRGRGAGRVSFGRRRTVPALEGAAEGASVAVPEAGAGIPSALDQLLARGRMRATLAMLGPAFVAAIAYVDPGNFATNIQGGAKYGYTLLWVVLAANLIAMLIQYLSAKLGIVTDRNLPEHVRARWPRPVAWLMWGQAEVIAMATDVAEFLGAAL